MKENLFWITTGPGSSLSLIFFLYMVELEELMKEHAGRLLVYVEKENLTFVRDILRR